MCHGADDVVIKQKLTLLTGDTAEVTRIMETGDRTYVEVSQSIDASEPTIMVAVNNALREHQGDSHG